jgi:glycosyltransferase involved in cell wall biosynthesis
LKIVHVCTRDGKGGAHRAAFRLNRSLQQLGAESGMLVSEKISSDPSVTALPRDPIAYLRRRLRWRNLPVKYLRYWPSRPRGYTLYSDHQSGRGKLLTKNIPDCDIINLHWVAQFIDYDSFFKVAPTVAPIVWTLHDMNPFTGGCHYSLECNRYEESCGFCPQLGSNHEADVSHQIWREKTGILKQVPKGGLHIITPSHWLADRVRASSIMGSLPFTVIPNGLDTRVFCPQDRQEARRVLGIPQDRKVILFVANTLRIRHKGFALLLEALNHLEVSDEYLLVSLGSGQPPLGGGVEHLHLGHINDNQRIAQVYSAADVFVIPSLQDNLPNTVMESMACGTPVVGFDVGGIPEMVRQGETGLLAPPHDVNALRETIVRLLGDDELRAAMGENCRQVALAEYSLEVQARGYLKLYHQLLNRHQRGDL